MSRRYNQQILPQPGEIRKIKFGSHFRILTEKGLVFVKPGEIVTILRSSLYRPPQKDHRVISATVDVLHEGRLLRWSGRASLCISHFEIL